MSDLFRGDAALANWLGHCDEVLVPLIVIGEIKAGFYGGTKQLHNERLLQQFLSKATVVFFFPAGKRLSITPAYSSS